MGKAYDFETRDRAEELYIVHGYTLDQVASATGVSLSQVKTWSVDDGWTARRDEYRQSLKEIRTNTVRLRKGLIEKALNSLDPQAVYAAASFERIAQLAEKKATSDQAQVAPADPEADLREIRTPQQAIDALQEAAEARMHLLLSRPGELTLSAIKDVRQVLALIDELKEKYKPVAAQKGLSDEAAEEIRRKILGI